MIESKGRLTQKQRDVRYVIKVKKKNSIILCIIKFGFITRML
jgi:hypothetical protein